MTTTILTQESYQAAYRFIEANGRPLEVARLRYHFNGGPASSVVDALQPYQNTDGGFQCVCIGYHGTYCENGKIVNLCICCFVNLMILSKACFSLT